MVTSGANCVVGIHALVPTSKPPAGAFHSKLSEADQDRLTRILSEPLEYIGHEAFLRPRVAAELFGIAADNVAPGKPWCNAAHSAASSVPGRPALPASSTLTVEREQRLFLQLNYARYRMFEILTATANGRLTAKAARELLDWHAKVVTARCEIVSANMPLVLAMAKRTRLSGMDYAELISEGNMALLRSVDKFDCGRGFKFSTYACRAILKSFSRVALRTGRYRSQFPTEYDPTLERSDHQERSRDQVEADCVVELKGILEKNRADLNEIEVRVLKARFALDAPADAATIEPQTLEQVGLLIGVTKERVRQIQNRALAKLRTALQEDFLAA